MLETEKKDAERQAVRLEKDKNALRSTLDKVSRSSQRNLCDIIVHELSGNMSECDVFTILQYDSEEVSHVYLHCALKGAAPNSFGYIRSFVVCVFASLKTLCLSFVLFLGRTSEAEDGGRQHETVCRECRLDRSLNTTEQELQEAQQQILMLQVGSTH